MAGRHGSRVAVGSAIGGIKNSGHVRVYEYGGSGWVQLGDDINGENDNDRFGSSVSLSSDGTRVAIGAPLHDGNGYRSGHVRVYEYNRSPSVWTQLGQDIDGENSFDGSGKSVSLSANGERVAIGANNNRDGGISPRGRVRVYQFNGSVWSQLGQDINDESNLDQAGHSVSLSANGERLAIGAPGNDGSGTSSGHVRVYEFIGSSWTQLGSDIDGESATDQSGWSVSLSSEGTRLAVGAPFYEPHVDVDPTGTNHLVNSGHVRVYDLEGFPVTAPSLSESYHVSESSIGSYVR